MNGEQDPAPHTLTTSDHPPATFDALFRSEQHGGGFSKVAHLADPTLPPEVEPFSFLCSDLLRHIAASLVLRPDDTLVDLGCGRGGPGLWLASTAGVRLSGVDFSAVAVAQAQWRAVIFGLEEARFHTGDLTGTGLPNAMASAVVCIDALQYASDRTAAAAEARRLLRSDGRLVLTGWHPRTPGDPRLPDRHRHTDWPAVLRTAGFASVACHAQPTWSEAYLRIYRVALQLGEPGADTALAGLQGEARRRLPTAHLLRRVAVTAIAP